MRLKIAKHLDTIALVVIIAATLVLISDVAFKILSVHGVNGWDGGIHFAMTKYYSDNFFPSLFGWVRGWNLGMPWPVGYTPLMTYFFSTLYHLIPLPADLIFKLVFLGIVISFPLIIFMVCRKLGLHIFASLVPVVCLFVLLIRLPASYMDISFQAIFDFGYYPYILATFFLLVLILVTYTIKSTVKRISLSALLFAAILLTNLHVAIATSIFLGSYYVVNLFEQRHKKHLLILIIIPLISLLLISFWLAANLSGNSYFSTYSLPAVDINELNIATPAIIAWLVLLAAPVVLLDKQRSKYLPFLITSVTITIICLLPINNYFRDLPWQPNRIISSVHLFVLFLTPLVIEKIVRLIKFFKPPELEIIGFILLFVGSFYFKSQIRNFELFVELGPSEQQLVSFLHTKTDGRSFIEMLELPDKTSTINISNILPVDGHHETIWGSYREGTMTTAFTSPVRNALSRDDEAYGVVCWLCLYWSFPYEDQTAPSLAYQYNELPIEQQINAAIKVFNTKYFAIYSDEMKDKIEKTKLLTKVASFGNWNVYQANVMTAGYRLLHKNPTLVFTNLNSRYRNSSDFDWLRINEEWLFNGDFDDVLVLAKTKILNDAEEFFTFKNIFIVDYKYDDQDAAFEQIIKLSEERNIFLLTSTDPLFFRLVAYFKDNPNPNVTILPRTGNPHIDLQGFFSRLAQLPTKDVIDQIKLSNIAKNTFQFSYNQAESGFGFKHQVYINDNYFPWWQDQYDGRVYLASPTNMVVVSDNDNTNLHFSTPEYVYFWMGISLFTLIGNCYLLTVRDVDNKATRAIRRIRKYSKARFKIIQG